MNLIIDVGNTRVKLALFRQTSLIEDTITPYTLANKTIGKWLQKNEIDNIIVSSVGKPDVIDVNLLTGCKKIIRLDHKTKVPFKNKYETPKTLGVDRIALVAAAADQYPKENVLIIDAGTCITYDILNKKNEYLGGAISPGINIRFKSLNDYTANLPLLNKGRYSLVGKNTNKSILSGVLNGIVHEIDGVIQQYRHKYSNLTVVFNRR